MISKQVLLGISLVLGGSVVFYALAKNDNQAEQDTAAQVAKTNQVAKPVVQPLTADVATEEKLLAQKQKEREAHTEQLQKHTEQLLAEQEKARQNAINKANAEANGTAAETVPTTGTSASQSELIAAPTVQTRPEAIEAARKAEEAKLAAEAAKKAEQAQLSASNTAQKTEQTKVDAAKADAAKKAEAVKAEQAKKAEAVKKAEAAKKAEQAKKAEAAKAEQAKKPAKGGQYQVKSGDSLSAIASRHGVSAAALAQANGMSTTDMLKEGRVLILPANAKAVKQTQPAKQTEQNKKTDTKKETKQSGKQETKTEKKTDKQVAVKNTQNPQMSGRYTVQVAISPDKAKVDAVVKQYKAAGYKVTTTNTSKGVRVVVGNEKTAEGAKALRNKINSDGRVNSNGAFIHQVQ